MPLASVRRNFGRSGPCYHHCCSCCGARMRTGSGSSDRAHEPRHCWVAWCRRGCDNSPRANGERSLPPASAISRNIGILSTPCTLCSPRKARLLLAVVYSAYETTPRSVQITKEQLTSPTASRFRIQHGRACATMMRKMSNWLGGTTGCKMAAHPHLSRALVGDLRGQEAHGSVSLMRAHGEWHISSLPCKCASTALLTSVPPGRPRKGSFGGARLLPHLCTRC